MPIYSDNEAELEDRLASFLAGAGATSSLAASAASLVSQNPSAELSPRLKAAVTSMVQLVERVVAINVTAFDTEAGTMVQFPEELVAKLAQLPEDVSRGEGVDVIHGILSDLRGLLDSPTPEAASRVEQFLGTLSRAENRQAQSLARGSFELEFVSTGPLKV